MFFEKIPEKGCKCTIAVRNTFFNLIKKNYKTTDALKLSFKVLKYHHPEIPDHKVAPKHIKRETNNLKIRGAKFSSP